MIDGVLAQDVAAIWPQILPQVERVLKKYDFGFDADHVLSRIQDREMQLWICDNKAIAITEIVNMPDFKMLTIPIVAGHGMKGWLGNLSDLLKAYGLQHGCKYLEGYGRKGWIRELAKHGYKDYSITVRCEL